MSRVEFQFPVKGKDTNNPIEKQPLLTSPYLENVRPYDQVETRMRGGQRPGCRRWGSGRIGGNHRIDKMVKGTFGISEWIEDNLITWLLVPYVYSCGSISMAAIALGAYYGVEYDFDCETDATYDSGWQESNVYTITGLTSESALTFRCRAREKSPGIKITEWSSSESVTPNAKPQPDSQTWATEPYASSEGEISMVADTATDPSGVEYYFTCESGAGGSDRTWADSASYTDTGLTPETEYCYSVKARDKSGLQCENTKSATKCSIAAPRLPGLTAANVWKAVEISDALYTIWTYDTGEGDFQYDTVGIAADGSGNVYVAGDLRGTKTVWKLDSSGSIVWDYDTGANTYRIAVDGSGSVHVAGARSSSKSVWKLDSSGNLDWDYDTGASSLDITVDSSGNVYVGGQRSGNNTIWKLDSSGNLVWDYDTGDSVRGIAVDSSGNVYVGSRRAADEDGNTGNVRKLNSSGVLQWFYDAGADYDMRQVAIDSSGNVYATGQSSGAGAKSVWKLDNDGNFDWDYETGDDTYGITIDSSDDIYVAGVRSSSKSIWKLDDGGNLLWSDDTGDITWGIYHDGTYIYIAGDRVIP